MGYAENPAWLSTKDLHDTYMSLASPSPPSPLQDSSTVTREKRIHIQVIQSSVVYSHVLSLVPLIHGVAPSAPEAQAYLDPAGDQPDSHSQTGPQGNGSSFPTGYPVRIPIKGHFDLVVHVGVGSRGAIAVEQLGHKRGYQIPDVKGELAPVATDQTETTRREKRPSEAEERERTRYKMGPSLESPWSSPDVVRGFGRGYEEFEDEEVNSNDIASLVHWLKEECEVPPVRQSHDAGRYLCDYIVSVALLAARKRMAADFR